jgi:xylan 1,4-beta-xylosidase
VTGDPRLDRNVRLIITGLGDTEHKVRLARIDEQHSNVVAQCPPEVLRPDEALWAHLRAHDELYEERLPDIAAQQHVAELNFALPMPGVARIRLSPALPPRPTVNNKENQP